MMRLLFRIAIGVQAVSVSVSLSVFRRPLPALTLLEHWPEISSNNQNISCKLVLNKEETNEQ